MNTYPKTFSDPSAERLLTEHLQAIDEHLRRTGAPADVRRQIVEDVRAQVRETAWTRGGANASADDVAAVLAEMDPPEAYGAVEMPRESGRARSTEDDVQPVRDAKSRSAGSEQAAAGLKAPRWVVDFRLLKTFVWWEIALSIVSILVGIGAADSHTLSKAEAVIAVMHLGLLMLFLPALVIAYVGLLRRWAWARWLYIWVSLGGLIFFVMPGGRSSNAVLDLLGTVCAMITGVIIAFILTTPEEQLFGGAPDRDRRR